APYTPSVAASAPTSTIPPAVSPPVTNAPSAVGGKASGGTPGLYGGTRNLSSCDPEKLVNFLETHPALGRAWASVEGIQPSQIRTYVSTLTPVILRRDTRVTNHGFSNGRPTRHQSVLQAGTAVLVDEYGVPRVRCFCGNPLLPPAPAATNVAYTGPKWNGFRPADTIVVVQNITIINNYTLVDVTNGQGFDRPASTSGTGDRDASVAIPTGSSGTGKATTTTAVPLPSDVSGTYALSITLVSGAKECATQGQNIIVNHRGTALTLSGQNGTSVSGTIDANLAFTVGGSTSGVTEHYEGRFTPSAGGGIDLTASGNLTSGSTTCSLTLTGHKT
ncbi:MAG: hypothetical protein QOJ09_146, partial [Actinomycetota bacterium]|nr:hypothetical protein [Actinomycetota bacterium]